MRPRQRNKYNTKLQLSKTSTSQKRSRFYGVLLLIWAGFLIFLLFYEVLPSESSINWFNFSESAGVIFIISFSVLLLISAFFLLTARVKEFNDTERRTYSLWPVAMKALQVGLTVLLLIIPFTLLLFVMDDQTFQIFGGIVIGIFWIAMIFLGIDMVKKINRYKKFGESVLITDKPSYKPGDIVNLKLLNDRLNDQVLYFNLTNVHEFWEGGGPDDGPDLKYETLFEAIKTGAVNQNIQFTIPIQDNVKPTCYHYIEPFYWSIEVSDNHEYFSQFIINVWD